jgi:hypothetical protein
MAWEDLPMDERGVRPGHPASGRIAKPTSYARDHLITSTNTVRKLIVEGAIEGYWCRAGSRMKFYVYTDSVQIYLREVGPINRKRRSRRQRELGLLGIPQRTGSQSFAMIAQTEPVSELERSLTALAKRVSALEHELTSSRGQHIHHLGEAQADVEWERRRRLELEDALAALEEDDVKVAEADALIQQAYANLRSAHLHLRASIARARQPRTVADLPDQGGDQG